MKERPILMSAPMVRATLAGTKTQTRRLVKPTMTAPRVAPATMYPWLIDGEQETDDHGLPCWVGEHPAYPTGMKWFSCPYGQPGDHLWVRETFARKADTADCAWYAADFVDHRAAGASMRLRWRPSIHMPRWASRLDLEITAVRVERVRDISHEDAIAEGFPNVEGQTWGRLGFSQLWDAVYAARGYGWAVNPWCWVVEFRRVQP